jgi:hypothetical protein
MAWHRTTLSAGLLGVAMLKTAISRHRPCEMLAAVSILTLALLLGTFTRQRRKATTHQEGARRLSPGSTLLIVAGATMWSAGCVIGTVVTG